VECYIKNDHEVDMCQIIQRHLFWHKPDGCGAPKDYDVLYTIKKLTKFKIKEPA
jgi:hypothetical protein